MEKKNLFWVSTIFLVAVAVIGTLIYTFKDDIEHIVKTGSELIVKTDSEFIVENNIERIANNGAKELPSFSAYTSDAVGIEITPQVTYEINDMDGLINFLDPWELESTNVEDCMWSYLYGSIKREYCTVICEYSFGSLMHENGRRFDENIKREINEKVKSKLNRLFGYVEIISIDYDCPLPKYYRQCIFEEEKANENLRQAEEEVRRAKEAAERLNREFNTTDRKERQEKLAVKWIRW